MIHKVTMPRVDANVEEGTLGDWLVPIGQAVVAGDPLVEVITDKASFELEAEQDGVLRSQEAPAGSVLPVGFILALLGDADEALPDDIEAENEAIMDAYRAALLGFTPEEPTPAPPPPTSRPRSSGAVRATPAARRIAAREGIDLGPLAAAADGVLRREDVEAEIQRRSES
jgi:pyruvate dehydrogenase E2 component (dihydrolipoyllysine-residue acetyltransferase)